MPNYGEVLVMMLFGSLLLWEYLAGVHQGTKRVKNDWLVDAISVVQLVITKPLIMLVAFSAGALFCRSGWDFCWCLFRMIFFITGYIA